MFLRIFVNIATESSVIWSSNNSSPRSSISSTITPSTYSLNSTLHHSTFSTPPLFLPHSSTAHYYRRPSSNTLQVPGYGDIGFLHHRNSTASSLEGGDRMVVSALRAGQCFTINVLLNIFYFVTSPVQV